MLPQLQMKFKFSGDALQFRASLQINAICQAKFTLLLFSEYFVLFAIN